MKLKPLSDSDRGADATPLMKRVSDHVGEPTLPHEVTTHIGEQLRSYYAELMSEPIPERFVRLLGELGKNDQEGHS
jgi:hypothetical protein